MFKKFWFVIPVVLLIAFVLYKPQPAASDKAFVDLINQLNEKTFMNEASVEDLSPVYQRLKNDEYAEPLVAEAIWLLGHNQSDEAQHPMAFVTIYVTNGEKIACPPHDLGHTIYYIRANDRAMVAKTVAYVDKYYGGWKATALERRTRFPNLYGGLDELINKTEFVLASLKAGNFDVTEETEWVRINSIC